MLIYVPLGMMALKVLALIEKLLMNGTRKAFVPFMVFVRAGALT
jgi:hypothetical protein